MGNPTKTEVQLTKSKNTGFLKTLTVCSSKSEIDLPSARKTANSSGMWKLFINLNIGPGFLSCLRYRPIGVCCQNYFESRLILNFR